MMFWITYYEFMNEENSTSERRGFPQKKWELFGVTKCSKMEHFGVHNNHLTLETYIGHPLVNLVPLARTT